MKTSKLQIIYDGACPLCRRTIRWLKFLDWFKFLQYRDLTDWQKLQKDFPQLDYNRCLEEMHVITPSGNIFTGFHGFRIICTRLPLGWLILPLLYLPPTPYLGQKFYLHIASNRKRQGLRCTGHVCG